MSGLMIQENLKRARITQARSSLLAGQHSLVQADRTQLGLAVCMIQLSSSCWAVTWAAASLCPCNGSMQCMGLLAALSATQLNSDR